MPPPNTTTHSFFDNRGGMNQDRNTLATPASYAQRIENMHLSPAGRWATADVGYRTLNPSAPLNAGARINALHRFTNVFGVEQTLVHVGNQCRLFDLTTGTPSATLSSSFAATQRTRGVAFMGDYHLVGAGMAPQRYTSAGTLVANAGWPPTIAGVTPGQPSVCALFANRLVLAGDANNPSLLYLSALENAQNFTPTTGATSAGGLQVQPGDGDRITALQPLFIPELNEQVLIVFKQRSLFMLTGFDADTFALQKLADDLGAVNQECVVSLGNDVWFLTPSGQLMKLSSAFASQGKLQLSSLSANVAQELASVNRLALATAGFATHLPQRTEVWWWLPIGTSTVANHVLVLNYGQGQPVWSVRTGLTATCGLHLPLANQTFTGDAVGLLHQQHTGNTYHGNPIAWLYCTPFISLGKPQQRKRFKVIELVTQDSTLDGLSLTLRWDLQANGNSVAPLQPQAEANLFYGTATYGTTTLLGVYGSQGTVILRLHPQGSGRLVQLQWQGTLPQQPADLEGWLLTTHNLNEV